MPVSRMWQRVTWPRRPTASFHRLPCLVSVRYAHRGNWAVPNVTGRFRPKRYGDGPVTGHRQPNTQLFTREHDNDLANKSHRLDRLTAVLGRPEAIFAALIATLALAARSSGKVVSAV